MRRTSTQRGYAPAFNLRGVALVSGMALATGDSCIKHKQTPAASVVPLTEELLSLWAASH